jgi:3-oxoacyl-[acyl-carrier-protein] synthase-3
MVADRLGLNNPAASDISAACAGFSYALAMADALVSNSQANHVLVIGVEKLSDWTDMHDRGTAFIFADGAGAVVVSPSETPQISPTVWGSDGSEFDAIISEPNWLELRNREHTKAQGQWPVLRMQGQKVFRWAVGQMPDVCRQILDVAGLSPQDINLFVPHQANLRITKAIMKALDFPESVKVATDIETAGNTSAASIPLALDRMREEGVAKSGDLALLVGFGAGLAYAGQVIRIP